MMQENFTINCEICDARKIKEENYKAYSQIMLNTDILLVNETSKEILSKLPVTINVDTTLEIPDDMSFHFVNGDFELNGSMPSELNSFLYVNGTLFIRPGSENQLTSFWKIYVNGDVRMPESMSVFPGKLHVNGSLIRVPDQCRELEDVFIMDKYFPVRAAKNGKYFAKDLIKITDPAIDAALLADKGISFITRCVLARENMLPSLLELFDETVTIQVIPSDYAYVEGDVRLSEALLERYGDKLYVGGSLFLNEASPALLSRLKAVRTSGDIFLTPQQQEFIKNLDISCRSLVLTREKILENLPQITVDSEMLTQCPGGIEIRNTAYIKVLDDVAPELIAEKLSIKNCACVSCSPRQTSAIQIAGKNIAAIQDSTEESEREADSRFLEMLKKLESSKMVNAEHYEL